MGLHIRYYQLVRPHQCNTLTSVKNADFVRVKAYSPDDRQTVEYYARDSEYHYYVQKQNPPSTTTRVEVDLFSCKHYPYHYYHSRAHDSDDDDDSNSTSFSLSSNDDDTSSSNSIESSLHEWKEEDGEEDHIIVKCYDRAVNYIYTSPTFELGKLYDVKWVGETMGYPSYPKALTSFSDDTTGLYTGAVLERIVRQLDAVGYDTLQSDVSLDATTMFAQYW